MRAGARSSSCSHGRSCADLDGRIDRQSQGFDGVDCDFSLRKRLIPDPTGHRVSKHRLVVIGGGNMGAALVGGLLAAGVGTFRSRGGRADARSGCAARRALPRCHHRRRGGSGSRPSWWRSSRTTYRRPWTQQSTRSHRILSIAAGVSLSTMTDIGFRRRRRTCDAEHAGAGRERRERRRRRSGHRGGGPRMGRAILGAVGTVERVTEPQLEVVTSLAGSGPAFLFCRRGARWTGESLPVSRGWSPRRWSVSCIWVRGAAVRGRT